MEKELKQINKKLDLLLELLTVQQVKTDVKKKEAKRPQVRRSVFDTINRKERK